jgi:ubiquinone/menaquinone biosynthesis C-methylase UbiE
MSMVGRPSQGRQANIFRSAEASEITHLLLLDRAVNEAMGEALPECVDRAKPLRVLDVGCGPGEWALKVARTYPQSSVVGIDINPLLITNAQSQARREELSNTHFEVMDALKPLCFADGAFDLVNLRFASTFVPRSAWPILLRECMRALRAGGAVRFTEADPFCGFSTSAAREKYASFLLHFFHQGNYGFASIGNSLGMTPMLASLLSDAGCLNIQYQSFVLDSSFGTALYPSLYICTTIIARLLQQSSLAQRMATQEQLDQLYQQMQEEMQCEKYRMLMYLLTAWGKKAS